GHTAVPLQQFRRSSSTPEAFNSLLKKKSSTNSPNRYLVGRRRDFSLSCRYSSNLEDGKSYGDCGGGDNISSYSSSSACSSPSPSEGWDWNRWTRHFSEIEQAENNASVLKMGLKVSVLCMLSVLKAEFQLEDAIEKEDFREAAKLKTAIAETTAKDSVAEIMSELKSAIGEERYHDASRLCQNTGSGLVGWWVGYSKDLGDPFGRLVQITPGTGRFIGKSYSPRQLITASPGTPLFEIFVVKDNEGYKMQVAFLETVKGNPANSSSSSDKSTTKGPSVVKAKNTSVIDINLEGKEVESGEVKAENTSIIDFELGEKEVERGEVNIDSEEAAKEGIKHVINFIKEKIPELNFKAVRVEITAEAISKDNEEQFIEEDHENITSDDINKEDNDIDNSDLDIIENASDSDVNLFIGGVLHNKEEILANDEYIRVPADIENVERDSFVLHIPRGYKDNDTEEDVASKVEVAAIAARGVSELMPPEVAKAFWNMDKVSPKISRDVREILKLAVIEAQKRSRLSEYTNFSRITTSNGDLDPFNGLYVGAFGPYGPEIVQLRRKYGNWNTHNDDSSSDVEFFEYVEAVKLTGDMNVPAGEVTFRAKVGKGNRLTNKAKLYPRELGVVASYNGQGRIAEFGFQNPKWVEGELLQLDGRSLGVPYINGVNLGFLYAVPEQAFLVLFHRLKLPE
ncbi:hypothetical protein STAS_34591, partial [Striga asiatica]